MTPIVVSSIAEHAYDRQLAAQSLPLGFHLTEEIAAAAELPATRVAYMRAGYEQEFYGPECMVSFRAENRLRRAGVRIVNDVVGNGLCHRKDMLYGRLAAAGVPVPWFMPNPTPNEVRLAVASGAVEYPIILRMADGCHAPDGMIRVENDDALERAHAIFQGGRFRPFYRTMAVKFIDSRYEGLFFRIRIYVIGGKVDLVATSVSDHWFVDGLCGTQPVDHLDREFMEVNERFELSRDLAADTEKLAAVVGRDVFSVDVVRDRDGRHYFVDVNPTYFFKPNVNCFPERMRSARLGHFRRVARHLYDLAEHGA